MIARNWVRGISLLALLGLQLLGHAQAQCSTAAWTSVTGSAVALGAATVPVGKSYEQSCGLTTDASMSPGFVTIADPSNGPVNETSFTARFYFLADGLSITSGDVVFFRAHDAATSQVELRIIEGAGGLSLTAFVRNGGVLLDSGATIPLISNVWQGIEVTWTTGAGSGSLTVKLDDKTQISVTAINNSAEVVNDMDYGIINAAAATGELVIDAVDVRRTGAIGLLAVDELINISTRAEFGTGNNIVIAGFIISGDTDKCVIIRGRGPTVGVPAGEIRLANPTLSLASGPTIIDTNDDWATHPNAAALSASGFAPTNASESAIFTCLSPGPYTALVSGVGGGTGLGIVEVFDADNSTPYLLNISTRAPIGTGNSLAIAGFIIRGNQSKQVLLRGRGPTVGVPAGVTRLPNPRLRLFDSLGVQFANNNDWMDAANSAAVTATGRAPTNNLEAALLITLAPGAYTAMVDDQGGATGVGIVEVFDQSGGVIANN